MEKARGVQYARMTSLVLLRGYYETCSVVKDHWSNRQVLIATSRRDPTPILKSYIILNRRQDENAA